MERYFSQVRAYNLELSEEQRIWAVGIEAEFDYELSVSLFEELLQRKHDE